MPIWLVTPLRVSYSVTVLPIAASPAVTTPVIAWVASLEVSDAVLIATVGATVSSVNTTALLVPVLPAASVSLATMRVRAIARQRHAGAPRPARADRRGADLARHPLTVSYNVTVLPIAASAGVTVPVIVWVATLEVSARRADRNRRRHRVEREHDRRAGAGVAGRIGVLGDDGVGAIARQRHAGGPQPARADASRCRSGW